MSRAQVAEERMIDAPAEKIYDCIADYRQHHPRFLPPAFSNFIIEEGGYGAGTIVSFDLKLANQIQHIRQRVEEPTPGSVLVEQTLDVPHTTTFSLRPDGARTLVRMEAVRETHGLRGIMERMLMPRMLAPLFRQELKLLDRYVAAQ
ncbi:MAG TPA: SRPBCC family protein [Nitrolancea sp.]|jgi:hypothetical protein|nr:SRPBCC family protein [Nitrolancea sp.]